MKIEDIFSDMPLLETDRVRMRRIGITDAQDMFEFSSNPEVTRYLSYDHTTIEDAVKYIEKKQCDYATGTCMIWGFEHKEHDKYIGAGGFTHWNIDEKTAELAYTISHRYWGNGIATETARRIIGFGFEIMDLNRIEARCWVENDKSARVMEKCGMKFEGILREQVLVKGMHRDVKMYSILKREYIGLS
jgi:[ribosomal protein S5]-alanine N-acetyltransferase